MFDGVPYLSVALFVPAVAILGFFVMMLVSMRLARRARADRERSRRNRTRRGGSTPG